MPEEYENLEEFLNAEEIEKQDEDILLWVALGLAYGIDILNEKLQSLEEQGLETEKSSESLTQIYGLEEESLESCECLLSEELWEELCKALGSDKITFMGIA